MTFTAGQRLGPYEIITRLGAGGMGEVWLAHDPTLKRQLAIKVLHDTDSDARQRFLHEARAAAKLNHPNIVGIYEAREVEGVAYIAMELVEGEPLTAKINPKGIPVRQALDYLLPIARALEAARAAGIIHRDIKPANVMVSSSGAVKLLDFGLAKRFPSLGAGDTTATASLTEQGQVVGTYAYMSPEQAQGLQVDVRTDIFSFGALAYELLAGRRPFRGDTPISTLGAIVHSDPAPLTSGSASQIPAELQGIVMRCLRKDPSRRFQTAADLHAALEDVSITGGTAAVERKKRMGIPVVAGVATVAAAAAIGWYTLGRKPEPGAAEVRAITFDGTLNVTPAISPDGKLLAFASDRGGRDNLDIWVRQTAGGGLVRLTSQPGVEAYPQFSPDGTKVFYLSGSQTVYEVAALGGPSREVLADAGPFSVSSRGEIVFVKMRPATYSGQLFTFDGRSAARWSPCMAISRPAWSADGNEVLFFGNCGSKRGGFRGRRNGGDPVFISDFGRLQPWVTEFATGPGDALLLVDWVGARGSGISRWAQDRMQSITRGTDLQCWPAVSPSGQVVFSQYGEQIEVRQLPDEPKSVPVSVATAVGHFAVSRDGRTLVYGRLTGGRSGELVVRDLIAGQERVFASHDLLGVSFGSLWPQVSPSGDQVIYRVVGDNGGTFLLRLPSGEVRRLATLEQFQLASDWSADGSSVFGECAGAGAGICELNPSTGEVTPMLVHPQDQLIYPSPSWDGKRMVFQRRRPGAISGIWMAGVNGGRLEPDAQWIRVSPEGTDCSRPRFSADGASVYFVMGKDGLRILARQRLNAQTGKPDGELELPVESPVVFRILRGGFGPYPLIAVTKRGLFYSAFITRGNLYMTEIR